MMSLDGTRHLMSPATIFPLQAELPWTVWTNPVSLLKRFLAERVISPKGGWLNDRCFIMGFSQGGSCALQLAPVQEPDLAVNGVVSISGWPLQNLPKF
ncbi:hypothetical protein BC829DRAFT_64905 [Chytridium lagenaria]|nr:hypothetical protein BC829DRAFT_64905 [Chytridium lagenaria]